MRKYVFKLALVLGAAMLLGLTGCKTEVEPTPTSYTVSISTGVENGSVRADKQTAKKNEAVTLTLSASEGYKLGSLSVKDASNNSVEIATVTAGTKYMFSMPESNVTVSASFTPESNAATGYTVGISEGIENGSVSTDRQTAQKGQTVTLTLTANAGYKFGSISIKDASNNSVETTAVTAGTEYTFVMPESNVTVSATFTATSYAVGISAGIENGSVSTNKQTAQKGETVTLTLSANAGYQFGSISVKDASNNSVETATVTAGTEYTFVMPESNVTVSATFTATSYAVSVSTGIENGSVSADRQTAQKGQTVTLTVSANEDYGLGLISVKDASNNSVETATVTAGTRYTFVMPESNVTVSATFTPKRYTVGISAGIENGSVSADRQTAQKGQNVTLTLAANAGYKFGSVSVRDASNNSVQTTAVTAGTKYTFVMPESNVTVSASFLPDTPIETSYTVLDSGTTGTMGTSGNYVLFGYWPQTIKADSVTVDETNSKLAGAYTYYKGSDGAWYAKIKENAYQTGCKYSNGTTVAQNSANSYKYFKVEPIKWRVLTDNYSGKRLLLAENILVNHRYAASSNDYASSEIRAYLNDTFWNTAFTDSEKSMIDETDVDNSAASTTDAGGSLEQATSYACGNTTDKIFLLSEKEATTTGYGFTAYNVYGTGNSRIRMTTDFAKASGAWQSTTAGWGGWWWLRSPYYSDSDSARDVNPGGDALYSGGVDYSIGGVCPALSLKN